jgi:hypothetical protein
MNQRLGPKPKMNRMRFRSGRRSAGNATEQHFQSHPGSSGSQLAPIDFGSEGRRGMTKFDERAAANMDVALEEAFAGVPHGGDHESRKYVAKKLIQSAGKGNLTLEGLRTVARDAFEQLSSRRLARPLRQHAISQRPGYETEFDVKPARNRTILSVNEGHLRSRGDL